MFAAAPGLPFPLRTTRETSFGLGAERALRPLTWKRLLRRLVGCGHVGVEELLHGSVDVRGIGRRLVETDEAADLDLEEIAGRKAVGEQPV